MGMVVEIGSLVTLDASALIAFLEQTDAHHGEVIRLLVSVREIIMHPVNFAEVLSPYDENGQEALIEDIRELFKLTLAGGGNDISSAKQLAEIRLRTGLKITDACALVPAPKSPLLTFDEKQATRALSIGISVVRNTVTDKLKSNLP